MTRVSPARMGGMGWDGVVCLSVGLSWPPSVKAGGR